MYLLLLMFRPLQGFNGADLRNICTEAGMFAIRAERDYVIHEDFMKVLSFGILIMISNPRKIERNSKHRAWNCAFRNRNIYVLEGFMHVSVYPCFVCCALAIGELHIKFCKYFCFSRHEICQAVRKLNEAKKLESSAHYSADFGKD